MRNDLRLYQIHGLDWWGGSQRFLRLLANLVPARLRHFDRVVDWRGRRVLDLGSGGGFMAEAMAARGARVVGIDPAWAALRAGQVHAAAGGLDAAFAAGVGEALPLADATLDVVVACDVLEHVADLSAVLDEVQRVLRPGGIFLFDTISRTLLARLIIVTLAEDVLRVMPRGTHDPALFIRPRELRHQLAGRGFEVGPFVGLGPRGLDRRLDFTFGRLPGTAILYMGHAVRSGTA